MLLGGEMTDTEILSRSDCFNCGSEAVYEAAGTPSRYRVDCCNIDCPVSTPQIVTAETASSFPVRRNALGIGDYEAA
jgi:hypothetical protein